jgi:hypothetical protein
MALMASCVQRLPLVEDRAPSLPFVSCTHRGSGQGCTATFMLRFLRRILLQLLRVQRTGHTAQEIACAWRSVPVPDTGDRWLP